MVDSSHEHMAPSRLTVGALGSPGHRTFYLQASEGDQVVSLRIEKEQVSALARGIENILDELAQRELAQPTPHDQVSPADLDLAPPEEPLFAVGNMELAYDTESSRIVIIVHELVDSSEQGATLRLWATLGQARALSQHAKEIVSRGRPICPLCHHPIDPEGHFCPEGNGHGARIHEA